MEKNSPSSMAIGHAIDGPDLPVMAGNSLNSTAAVMGYPVPRKASLRQKERARGRHAPPRPYRGRSRCDSATHDGDVVLGPAAVRHAGRRWPHLASGVRQKWIWSKLSMPLVLQPSGAEQRIALAGRRHGRQRAEPRGHVALHLRTDRPLHPCIGAVGMLGVGMHHRGVGPSGGALGRDHRSDRLLLQLERIDLVGPGSGGGDAFVLEVAHLHGGVMPVAMDQRLLRAQDVERRRVLRLR